MIRILLVDDHAIVREGFKRLMDREPDFSVVGEATSRLDALPLLASEAPDLLITDLSLTDGTGIVLVDDVARHHPATKAIVVSMYTGAAFIAEALQRGARGYITKDAAADELVLGIRAVCEAIST